MCMLCIEIQKKTMKPAEIARAYMEIPAEELEKGDHWAKIMLEINDNGYDLMNISEIMYNLRKARGSF